MEHDIKLVEVEITKLNKSLKKLSFTEKQEKEILLNIKKPGWTTPAEFRMFMDALKNANLQINALNNLKNSIQQASAMIGS